MYVCVFVLLMVIVVDVCVVDVCVASGGVCRDDLFACGVVVARACVRRSCQWWCQCCNGRVRVVSV